MQSIMLVLFATVTAYISDPGARARSRDTSDVAICEQMTAAFSPDGDRLALLMTEQLPTGSANTYLVILNTRTLDPAYFLVEGEKFRTLGLTWAMAEDCVFLNLRRHEKERNQILATVNTEERTYRRLMELPPSTEFCHVLPGDSRLVMWETATGKLLELDLNTKDRRTVMSAAIPGTCPVEIAGNRIYCAPPQIRHFLGDGNIQARNMRGDLLFETRLGDGAVKKLTSAPNGALMCALRVRGGPGQRKSVRLHLIDCESLSHRDLGTGIDMMAGTPWREDSNAFAYIRKSEVCVYEISQASRIAVPRIEKPEFVCWHPKTHELWCVTSRSIVSVLRDGQWIEQLQFFGARGEPLRPVKYLHEAKADAAP